MFRIFGLLQFIMDYGLDVSYNGNYYITSPNIMFMINKLKLHCRKPTVDQLIAQSSELLFFLAFQESSNFCSKFLGNKGGKY